MPAELIRMNPENPNLSDLQQIADAVRDGAVIIYPTDTVYGLGCDITKTRSVERILRIKGKDPKKANLAMIFYDLSHISEYSKPISNSTFRLLKKALPGPFTFILEANNNIPKIFKRKKKEIGIRIPNNLIPREIVRIGGTPIVTTSIHDDNEIVEYTSDPYIIYENYKDKVDLIIDGGYGNNIPSTIVDATQDEFKVIREGLGDLDSFT